MGKKEDRVNLGVGYFERADLLAVGRALRAEEHRQMEAHTDNGCEEVCPVAG